MSDFFKANGNAEVQRGMYANAKGRYTLALAVDPQNYAAMSNRANMNDKVSGPIYFEKEPINCVKCGGSFLQTLGTGTILAGF